MIFERTIEKRLRSWLFKGKVLIIYGARQVGKTTLLKKLIDISTPDVLYLDAEDPVVRTSLTNVGVKELEELTAGKRLLLIDEAQRVRNIGSTLKLLADHLPKLQVIATGSSSFDLANKVKEPLTGRAIEFNLFPLSIEEVSTHERKADAIATIPHRMVYGMYPDVVERGREGGEVLRMITSSYVYKDALTFEHVRDSEVLDKLLRALALQVGSEVSFPELANLAGTSQVTVRRYIRILEQAFIIFRLKPYFSNRRKELSKMRKIYFWDIGIRNALISNLNPIDVRTDTGALWENFFIVERLKFQLNRGEFPLSYFWRTYSGQEIDYIEEIGGIPTAFECKMSRPKSLQPPPQWTLLYPDTKYTVVTPEDPQGFLGNI